ncbi:unnamed protein product [Blepharisma stoltei]|uniref:Uncharacterized protein n=1 Tax=Blepharisma stoltei TaxID=1481888 RepID=A0AAU9JZS0_9CILI|nr:unnamed protein product [Blepharisma stoltei]
MRARTLLDAHCHLQEINIIERVLEEANRAGVTDFICNGIQENDWNQVLELNIINSRIIPCIGIHPWYINSAIDGWEERMEALLASSNKIYVGEIGLDHYKSKLAPKMLQEDFFRRQIRIALKYRRLMSIHCVSAFGKVIKILRQEMKNSRVPFIMHSYEGPWEMTQELLAHFPNEVMFSLSMVSVWKAKHQSVIERIPLTNILIETDSPSQIIKEMIPEPLEEEKPQNFPKYLPLVFSQLCRIKNSSEEETAEQLYHNFQKILPDAHV